MADTPLRRDPAEGEPVSKGVFTPFDYSSARNCRRNRPKRTSHEETRAGYPRNKASIKLSDAPGPQIDITGLAASSAEIPNSRKRRTGARSKSAAALVPRFPKGQENLEASPHGKVPRSRHLYLTSAQYASVPHPPSECEGGWKSVRRTRDIQFECTAKPKRCAPRWNPQVALSCNVSVVPEDGRTPLPTVLGASARQKKVRNPRARRANTGIVCRGKGSVPWLTRWNASRKTSTTAPCARAIQQFHRRVLKRRKYDFKGNA